MIGAYLLDRGLLFIFAFPVLKASMEAMTKQEIFNIARVIALCTAIMYYLTQQDYTELWEEMERQENATLAAAMAEQSYEEYVKPGIIQEL